MSSPNSSEYGGPSQSADRKAITRVVPGKELSFRDLTALNEAAKVQLPTPEAIDRMFATLAMSDQHASFDRSNLNRYFV